MTVNSILRWAAGANVGLPFLQGSSSDLLLELMGVSVRELTTLLQEHRLTQRFLHRVTYEQPAWCGPELIKYLTRENEQTQSRLSKQIGTLNEVIVALQTAEGNAMASLVLIKGYSLFALTGQPQHQRYAGDLDVFVEDAELLWQVLHHLGFEGKRHYTYEFGKARRNDVVVDVHNFYPVPSYPTPREHRGKLPATFTESSHCQVTALPYSEVRKYSVPGRTALTQSVLIPQPSMMALVLTAHSFRNYVQRPHYNSANLGIRLGELSDIVELYHHPDFDKSLFAQLTQRYQAQDAWEFITLMARQHLGVPLGRLATTSTGWTTSGRREAVEPSSELIDMEPGGETGTGTTGIELASFPENLFWGGWLVIDNLDDLLQPRSLCSLLRTIGVASIMVPCDESRKGNEVNVPAGQDDLYLSKPTSLQPFLSKYNHSPLHISTRSHSGVVEIRVGGLGNRLFPILLRLHLGSQNYITVHFHSPSQWSVSQKDFVPELTDYYEMEIEPDNLSVILRIPFESLVFTEQRQLTVPVLVGLKSSISLPSEPLEDDSDEPSTIVSYYACNLCLDRYGQYARSIAPARC
jgi:hypothetical protein